MPEITFHGIFPKDEPKPPAPLRPALTGARRDPTDKTLGVNLAVDENGGICLTINGAPLVSINKDGTLTRYLVKNAGLNFLTTTKQGLIALKE